MALTGLKWTLLLILALILVLLTVSVAWVGTSSARSAVLYRKTIALYWRNPAREAAEAAAHGDFRLAWAHAGGPLPSPSSLPGVECTVWFRSATGKWLSTSDMRRTGDDTHEAAAYRFLTRYNQALIANPTFPYPELCAQAGAQPKRRYTGPVRNYAEAARAGDLDAVRRLSAAHAVGIDGRDMLGYTPLQWALRDGHGNVAAALLQAGADPNLRGPDGSGNLDLGPAALARALLNDDEPMVRLLLQRGARMTGYTGLCDRTDLVPQNGNQCTWPALVASHRRLDLLPAALVADDGMFRDPGGASPFLTGRDELVGVFIDAAQKDEALAYRLIPFVHEDQPGARIAWLLAQKREALAFAFARANAPDLGFSRAEAEIWAAAADNGHADTLAFLADFAGELNLLPHRRLAACRASAAAGAITALVDCVKDAAAREAAIEVRIRKGDVPGLLILLGQASDLHVHGRASVADLVVRSGTPAMARAALPLLAPIGGGREPWRPAGGTYHGPVLAQLSQWKGYGALRARLTAAPAPLALALARRDVGIVDAVATAHPADIEHQFGMLLNPMPSGFEEQADGGHYPDAPPEPNRTIALTLIREAARRGDQWSLGRMLQVTVSGGWDELSRAILRAGFDARHARRPDTLWERWSGLGSPCRPSTGAMLIQDGLPTSYPLDPLLNGEPPMWIIAAGCGNAASARVLAAADPAQLRFMAEDGSTLVDVAEQHRRPRMAAALRALGVRRGAELTGRMAANRAARRQAIDWDIVQDDETR